MIPINVHSLLSATQAPQDLSDPLNSPIAVIGIMAMCAVVIREVIWGVATITKRIKGETPDAVNAKLADAIVALNQNLTLQNLSLQQLSKDIDRSHMSVIRHFESIERDLRK